MGWWHEKAVKSAGTASALSVLLSGCAVTGPSVAPDGTIRTSQEQACKYDYAASAGVGAAGGAFAGSLLGGGRNQGQNALIGAAAGAVFALLLTSYLEKRCKALDGAMPPLDKASAETDATAQTYRSPVTLRALRDFWTQYFQLSQARLVEFGEPALLSPLR
jgi:hypothetical protein